MRPTLRPLASIKPGTYLTPHNPTGLTGLFTHPHPRPTLIHLYNTTLEKLSLLPPSSVYRQSASAIAKHRLAVVEAVKPAGYEQWLQKVEKLKVEHPERFKSVSFQRVQVMGDFEDLMERSNEGGLSGAEERRAMEEGRDPGLGDRKEEWTWEEEPGLEAGQISEIEEKIGAGLIEEVIQVAEGELKLVDAMAEHKVWENLTEQAPEGQWSYHARDQHTPGTQEPPT